MISLVITFFVINTSFIVYGQEDSKKGINDLKSDTYLHPIDLITPYTLKKGEKIYAQSIQTLPFPSWGFIGITDNLTAQIDLLPWIFGSFTELRKPIPSLNFRYQFFKQKNGIPTIAMEAMFVHFWDTLKRFETDNLTVWENGSYWHFKPVFGYQLKEKWFINFSLGADYIGELILQNNDSASGRMVSFEKQWNPNYSLSIDYRPSPWISYHVGYSYGSTLTYLENVPRKKQLDYGFRMAPFYKSRLGILRNFRLELVAINAFFSDIDAREIFPLPVFPYLYWQWEKKVN